MALRIDGDDANELVERISHLIKVKEDIEARGYERGVPYYERQRLEYAKDRVAIKLSYLIDARVEQILEERGLIPPQY